jgi:HEAT repeats
MIRYRVSFLMAAMLVAAAGMQAQPAPPQPPEPPTPPEPPIAVTPAPPEPPSPPEPFDFNFDFGPDFSDRINAQVNAAMEKVDKALAAANISLQTPFFQRGFDNSSNDDRNYDNGQRAIDRSNWNGALKDFTAVANNGGPRADGALYWKAYALNKLARRDEALAAIAELRKSYAKSRWLRDANALEIEVKQAAGQNVSPDAQPDEELKLLALNALASSDPDRAMPILENILKGSQPPRLKERALFVLGQNGSPQAQQLLAQIARGTGNPDLQLKAIQYLGLARDQNNGQVLAEVYSSSSDPEVKRAVINALALQERNTKSLVDLARKETNPELKRTMVMRLASMRNNKDAEDYMLELLK